MMPSPVVRLTLRGVLARKFRILLTILAVVSGVAFVSGAFILTDSVKGAINNLFVELRGEVDLEIRTEIAFGDSARAERDPVDVSLMKDIAAIDGVRLVEANLLRQATIIKSDGEPLQTSGPAFGISWTGPDGLDGRTLLEGVVPTKSGEVAIDKASAKRAGYVLGDKVTLVGPIGKGEFTLVGLTGTGSTSGGGGASVSAFDPITANEFLGADNKADSIYVGITVDASRSEVQQAIEEVLPSSAAISFISETSTGSRSARAESPKAISVRISRSTSPRNSTNKLLIAPLTLSVKMNAPDTNATPLTTARIVKRIRNLRASTPRKVSRTTGEVIINFRDASCGQVQVQRSDCRLHQQLFRQPRK